MAESSVSFGHRAGESAGMGKARIGGLPLLNGDYELQGRMCGRKAGDLDILESCFTTGVQYLDLADCGYAFGVDYPYRSVRLHPGGKAGHFAQIGRPVRREEHQIDFRAALRQGGVSDA